MNFDDIKEEEEKIQEVRDLEKIEEEKENPNDVLTLVDRLLQAKDIFDIDLSEFRKKKKNYKNKKLPNVTFLINIYVFILFFFLILK